MVIYIFYLGWLVMCGEDSYMVEIVFNRNKRAWCMYAINKGESGIIVRNEKVGKGKEKKKGELNRGR